MQAMQVIEPFTYYMRSIFCHFRLPLPVPPCEVGDLTLPIPVAWRVRFWRPLPPSQAPHHIICERHFTDCAGTGHTYKSVVGDGNFHRDVAGHLLQLGLDLHRFVAELADLQVDFDQVEGATRRALLPVRPQRGDERTLHSHSRSARRDT